MKKHEVVQLHFNLPRHMTGCGLSLHLALSLVRLGERGGGGSFTKILKLWTGSLYRERINIYVLSVKQLFMLTNLALSYSSFGCIVVIISGV